MGFGHPVSFDITDAHHISQHTSKKKSLGQAQFKYFGGDIGLQKTLILWMEADRMHISCETFLICAYPQVEGSVILPVAGLAHM